MAGAFRIIFDKVLPNSDMTYTWVEWQFIFLFLFGIVLSLADVSFKNSFIIMLIAGLMFGRLLYRWSGKTLPYFIFICLGFSLGYLLFLPEKLFLLAIYFAGILLAYQLHKNKVLSSVEW